MNKQNFLIKEVLDVMKMMKGESKAYLPEKLDQEALEKGLFNSRSTCKQEEFVFATPWMKNLMIICGDVTQSNVNGEWKTTKFPINKESKAVRWMNDVVNACRVKFNGQERHDYPTDVQVDNPILYDIDCWNGWKEEIWDIKAGQAKEREEGFKRFANPKTNMSIDEVIKTVCGDPALQKAIEVEFSILPEVKASTDVIAISDPFMNKKTGVSYPDYRNDSTVVEGSDITYGKYEIQLVERAYAKGLATFKRFVKDNNVYTGYPRNQRGKGRPLIAQSRRDNLAINMINGVEMKRWQENNILKVPFLDEEGLLESFIKLGETILANPQLDVYNFDYSRWDQNLGAGWICLQNAVRYLKAQGTWSKELVRMRNACALNGMFVNGPANKVVPIYGRQFSGYIDTTLGNTAAQRLVSRYAAISSNRNHLEKVTYPLQKFDLWGLGDDLLLVLLKDLDVMKTFMKTANEKAKVVIHEDEKHARGLMFLQWRAVKLDGQWIMAYNWPRVLRSMLSKESAKGLGKAGWVLSAYQQLGKLVRYPKMCAIVFNIIASLDPQRLMVDIPVSEIINMSKAEDAEMLKGKAKNTNKYRRQTTTAEKLFNNNPTLKGVVDNNGKVDLDENYFTKIQKVLRQVNNPEFLQSVGFKNPDLNKVHFK